MSDENPSKQQYVQYKKQQVTIPADYKFPTRYTMSQEESITLLPESVELKEELTRIRILREKYDGIHQLVRPSWVQKIEPKTSFMDELAIKKAPRKPNKSVYTASEPEEEDTRI